MTSAQAEANRIKAFPRYRELAELTAMGHGARAIADLWGLSTQRVYQLLHQAKLYGYLNE